MATDPQARKDIEALTARVTQLEAGLTANNDAVSTLEGTAEVYGAALAGLEGRTADLEARVDTLEAEEPPPVDPEPLEAHIAAVQKPGSLVVTLDGRGSTGAPDSYEWDTGREPDRYVSGPVVDVLYPHGGQRTVSLTVVRDTIEHTATLSFAVEPIETEPPPDEPPPDEEPPPPPPPPPPEGVIARDTMEYADSAALRASPIYAQTVDATGSQIELVEDDAGRWMRYRYAGAEPSEYADACRDYYVMRRVALAGGAPAIEFAATFRFSRGYCTTLPNEGCVWLRDLSGEFQVGETLEFSGGRTVPIGYALHGGAFPLPEIDAALYFRPPSLGSAPYAMDEDTVRGGTSGATGRVHGGWTGGICGRSDHKFLRFKRNNWSGYDAVNLGIAYGAKSFCLYRSVAGTPNDAQQDLTADKYGAAFSACALWDGEPHTVRVVNRIASAEGVADGLYRVEFDGQLLTREGIPTTARPVDHVTLCDNRNTRVLASHPMWIEWGPWEVRVLED